MRIASVTTDDVRQLFVVRTWRASYGFPFCLADPAPGMHDGVAEVYVDEELAGEGFTYVLSSGAEGSVLLDEVLEYCQDPEYLRNMLLYELTLEAQRRLRESTLSRREIIRRLGTSPAQFYRLIDQTNYTKSVDKVISLLAVLGCDIELKVRPRRARAGVRECEQHRSAIL